MAAWLSANMGNIIVILILLAVIVFGIFTIIKDKKTGKGCGCGCAHCAMKDKCHKKTAPPSGSI